MALVAAAAVVCVIAYGLRVYGHEYEAEFLYNPNELEQIRLAEQAPDFDPTWSAFGWTTPRIAAWFDADLLTLRVVSAALGAFTVALVMVVAWRLFGVAGAFVSGGVATLSPALIQLGHFWWTDSVLVPATMLVLAVAVLAVRRFTWPGYLLLCVAFGFAFATKLPALALGPAVAMVGAFHAWDAGRLRSGRARWLLACRELALAGSTALIIAIGIYIAVNPDTVTAPDVYFADTGVYSFGHVFDFAGGGAGDYMVYSFLPYPRITYTFQRTLFFPFGATLWLAVIPGVVYALAPLDRARALVLVTTVSTFVFVEVTEYRPLRFYYPFLACLAILAGGAVPATRAALRKAGQRAARAVAGAVVALALLPALAYALAYLRVYEEPTAREEAQRLMRNRYTGRGDVTWQGIMFFPGVDHSVYTSFLLHGTRPPGKLKRLWCDSEMIVFSGTLFWWDLLHGDEEYAPALGLEAPRAFLKSLDAGELGFRRIRIERYPTIGPFEFNDDWTEVTYSWFDHPPVTIYLRQSTPRWAAAERRVDAVLAPFGPPVASCRAYHSGPGGERDRTLR